MELEGSSLAVSNFKFLFLFVSEFSSYFPFNNDLLNHINSDAGPPSPADHLRDVFYRMGLNDKVIISILLY